MNIHYLTYKEIDKSKWDECIKNSINGLIYAESVYLDAMAADWHAIVLNDYEAVMPLTWKRKWRIHYLYQPAFTQQTGIFFRKKLTDNIMHGFMEAAFAQFKFAEININYLNIIDWQITGFTISLRNNFILQLGSGYETIFAAYDPYIKQRLNRLKKFSLQYKESIDHAGAIKLYRELYSSRMPSLSAKDCEQFAKLCKILYRQERVLIRQVYKNDGKELLAVALLLKDNNRIYNIISCILPNGKKLLANYFLYDALIREFSNEEIILDFEGSDIPGVAYFYNKFSGSNQQYAFMKLNRLPLPIKLLKR